MEGRNDMRAAAVLAFLMVSGGMPLEAGASEPMGGVALSPYQADQSPLQGRHPSAEDIDRDMAVLEGRVGSVRGYGSLNGGELIPAAAARQGMTVTQGAWITGSAREDEAEIASLVRVTRQNANVLRVLVGNEAILRGDVTVARLIETIEWVKGQVSRQVEVPVSTAEPWHVWLAHPELAAAVDFITAHILPYWDGVPIGDAVDYTVMRHAELRRAYPGKPILIGEVGWPSAGPKRGGAEASPANQAKFLTGLLAVAAREGLDYYVMEAFDQPWKSTVEGTVGAHWGVWDAARRLKFPLPERAE
jgi:exo-beta-1,3-glucanase (GH17 family)